MVAAGFPLIKGNTAEFPLKKAVRGRFLRQKQEANGTNTGYRWNSPLKKLAGIGFFYEHQCTNAMNAYHYWDSPLKKGDKGGCFLCCLNPVIMSFQSEDVQKPTPHSFSKGDYGEWHLLKGSPKQQAAS